ncbi:MAG: ABC transporter permease [Clostridiales bacterium]|jgi:oligopeptide transport system permease protein|nr:ABC transporter permease [Clostridiales bacterium]
MVKYILKRVAISIGTVFILATVTFFLVKLLPGDPFQNPTIPAQIQEKQRAYYGLDKPVAEQYFIYMGNLLKGDLGYSLKKTGHTVSDIIGMSFPVSATLGITSLIFSVSIGLLFGTLCAQFKNKWPDYLLMIVAVLGIALPSMVIGPILRNLLGVKLGILPATGWEKPSSAIMPAFVLGLGVIAGNTRAMRASMLSVITQDYVTTARAKGLSPMQVVMRHQFKNSLVPILTSLGPQIASTLTGSFVVETIFRIPGMGKYFVDSISNLDYTMIMGLTIFFGSFLVLMNLLVDIAYAFVDPRIRFA